MRIRHLACCFIFVMVLLAGAFTAGLTGLLGLSFVCDDNTEFLSTSPVTPSSSMDLAAPQLFDQWLGHFREKSFCVDTKLEDYRVESVTDYTNLDLMAEYPNEKIYSATFSVKPNFWSRDYWTAGNGIPEYTGWIISKHTFIGIKNEGTHYVMRIIGSGL